MASPPCNWVLDMDTCGTWGDYETEVQDAAKQAAMTILWAATGRRYGLCEVTVRPYGIGAYGACAGSLGWIADGVDGWLPYSYVGGAYRSLTPFQPPRCEIWLPGRVDSVLEVMQDGVIVDPGSYRVDDWTWLVRTDGGCWPTTVDMGSDADVFQVTYMNGTPVPRALLDAAATLACEWAKGIVGDKSCRLPARVSAITRQGVSMTALDTDSLAKRGFVGIQEVDMVIYALNPKGIDAAARVYTPDLPYPRRVTG